MSSSINPILLSEFGAASSVILSMVLPPFRSVGEILGKNNLLGNNISIGINDRIDETLKVWFENLLQIDIAELWCLLSLVGFLLFLGYGTQTKPLKLIRPLIFFIGFTPYFALLSLLLFGCWFFGVPPSLSLRFAFNSGISCWVIWATVVFKNYLDELFWSGVPSLPLIGSLPSLINAIETFQKHQFTQQTIEKYGMSVPMRIGDLKENILADPTDVEYILKTNHKNFVKGPLIKDIFMELLGDGIFNADGHLWYEQRKTASKEFSVGKFRNYMVRVFGDHAESVLQCIELPAQTKETIDIQDIFFRFTFDSFSDLAFGASVRSVEAKKDAQPPFAHAFDQANIIVANRLPDPFRDLKKMLNIGSERELVEHIKVIDEFIYSIIEERKKLSPEKLELKEDFLSRFMRMSDPTATGKMASDKYLRDLVVNFMIAGRDTTASGLSWTIYELCQHPQVVKKIRDEIESILGESEEGSQAMKPTYDQLKEMHYLHGVVSEALRLHPPVPHDGKFVVEDDILPSGLKVYAGDLTSFTPYAMGRHPKLWEDPLTFNPDRWLENGKFKRVSPYKFSVFQAGPRQCLGVDMSYLEAKLMLVMLLQKYDFQLAVDPSEVKNSVGLTMSAATGIPVTLAFR